ncbi:MAG: hypothetical protein M3O62_17050 [Pseudomonadota bacterium]|nr:hypothetical protein [Pseudomonadota bacterium]
MSASIGLASKSGEYYLMLNNANEMLTLARLNGGNRVAPGSRLCTAVSGQALHV